MYVIKHLSISIFKIQAISFTEFNITGGDWLINQMRPGIFIISFTVTCLIPLKHTINRTLVTCHSYLNAKQKHPGCKKSARPIRRSIANRYVYKGGQVTKPIIVVKICYKLLYVIQVVKKTFDK